jgi:soluble lytic murein transglycosylase-like protein
MRRSIARLLATAVLLCGSYAVTFSPALASQRVVPATPAAIAVYARVLRHINPQMPGWQSRDLARRVLVNAERWRIDATMLVAIVTVESSWHTHAVSSAGAIGLGQLMPGTAALLGVNPHDPKQNLFGAARYLRGLMQRFGSRRYSLVFAAYNAGPKAVSEYGGIPPYDETESYVVRVLETWKQLAKTIHLPAAAFAVALPAHGLDIDYWLDANTPQ